jgi:DNA-binding transcriptional LysR family regulator
MELRAESLTVQQMRTFCSVYEHGGYSNAERHLGLSGPTMWEHVKTLEMIYHQVFFERTGRNVRPTAPGHVLYQLLIPLLANIESSFEVIGEEAGDAPRQVSLVTGVRMMMEELGEPLAKFRKLNPNVKLRLMTSDNQMAQSFVLEGKADVALLIEPPPAILAKGVTCERLYPIEYLAVLPPRHRLSKQAELTLADIAAEPLILGNQNTVGRQQFEQAVFRLGLTQPLTVVAETDNSAVTVACVRAGIGVGVIAGKHDGNLTRHVTTKSLAKDLGTVNIVAAYRTGRSHTKVVRQLLDLLKP